MRIQSDCFNATAREHLGVNKLLNILQLQQKVIQNLSNLKMASNKIVKYRVSCQIHKLKISKNIQFDTKITWKRHQNKAETRTVRHAHGYSIFNEILELEFNLTFNTDTMLFESKNTELVAVIEYQGKVKSGGYVKYNISENLNTNPHGVSKVTIPLSQCPDPSAFIEASFSYERLSDQVQADDVSVLNVSSRDLNMSRIDFHDDKLSLQMDRINSLIQKFQSLSQELPQKIAQNSSQIPSLKTKLQTVEGDKKSLQKTITKLQKQLIDKQNLYKEDKKKLKVEADQLLKLLEKKGTKGKDYGAQDGYKEMYEATLKELEELKSSDGMALKQSLDFKFASQMDDVKEVANFQAKSARSDEDEELESADQLARQNTELQSKVASMSHKMAQLFNASYQYGGAKLLDYLQTSIGLTQLE